MFLAKCRISISKWACLSFMWLNSTYPILSAWWGWFLNWTSLQYAYLLNPSMALLPLSKSPREYSDVSQEISAHNFVPFRLWSNSLLSTFWKLSHATLKKSQCILSSQRLNQSILCVLTFLLSSSIPKLYRIHRFPYKIHSMLLCYSPSPSDQSVEGYW